MTSRVKPSLQRARVRYPFAAIVGQEQMKLALLLNAINPRLGGVLIRGEKGTAKSTAVRALAELLPEIEVVAGCPYNCPPVDRAGLCAACQASEELPTRRRSVAFVELPVGATEDRVVGSIDLEQAIMEGERRFEPGLLAAAHRGILYVDEVNLLNDHLVDVLLDAAAMGRNYVEREGVSIEHPAEFLLVGTMNPEEGELRPQLLDRFALAVDVAGLRDQPSRAEVVRRRLAFERDPEGFVERWRSESAQLREQIARAQQLLPQVVLDDRLLDLITYLCCRFEVDGLRADIVIYKTAQTLAAYEGRTQVNEDDVRRAALLALPHRRRRQPFDRPELDPEQVQQAIDEWRQQHPPEDHGAGEPDPGSPSDPSGGLPESPPSAGPSADGPEPPQPEPGGGTSQAAPNTPASEREAPPPASAQPPEQRFDPAGLPPVGLMVAAQPRAAATARGRRSTVRGTGLPGHYVAAVVPRGRLRDLALDATLRASAPFQRARSAVAGPGARSPKLHIRKGDLREKLRETKAGNLVLFVVDASGSMAARERMALAKGACVQLLKDAYQKRDRVGLIAFRGRDAQLLLPPTNSVDLAESRLRELPTGGRTPLGQGLRLGLQVAERYRTRLAGYAPLLVVLSDWRPNVAITGDPVAETMAVAREIAAHQLDMLVVDGEAGPVRLGVGRRVAESTGSAYLPLDALRNGDLAPVVRRLLRV